MLKVKGKNMNNDIPKEIKILHIHRGSELHKSYVEFIKFDNGKSYILSYDGFVKRYGAIDEEILNSK